MSRPGRGREQGQGGHARAKGEAKAKGKKERAPNVEGRTIYLHNALFERIMVQAHRKRKTISEYVTGILERQVPDYRTTPSAPVDTDAA